MTSPGRILIVDDDPDFVAIYRELLESQGLTVDVAHSGGDATRCLEAAGRDFDVVLLDQKLHGKGGPDSGLELVSRITALAPFAKTVLVTGYATPDAIERAFRLGVYDYLVKNGAFEALLRAKVRNAIEVTRSQRLAALNRADMLAVLRETWQRVQTETDRNRKGKALEDLVQLLFRATPGFERVTTNLRNEVEEIDVVIENRSDDPAWKQDGSSYILAECKNWSRPCDVPELRNFQGKLTNKFGRANTGFFIAPGGFTQAFIDRRLQDAGGRILIVPVGPDDLISWLEADDRMSVLNELHKRAVFAARE